MKNNNFIYDFKEKLKKHNLFVLVGLFVVLISSLITITTGLPLVRKLLNESIFYEKHMRSQIESLEAGTQIETFKKAIGEPYFVNDLKDSSLKEYVFVNKLFYLDALVDQNGNTVQYAVTTRKSDFNPEFMSPVFDLDKHQYKVKLGKARLNQLPEMPDKVAGCMGANYGFYYETHYLGNPANYQYYGFGFNMSGISDFGKENVLENLDKLSNTNCPIFNGYSEEKAHSASGSAALNDFRNNTTINTYLVTAPFQNPVLDDRIGVSYQQVRILDR